MRKNKIVFLVFISLGISFCDGGKKSSNSWMLALLGGGSNPNSASNPDNTNSGSGVSPAQPTSTQGATPAAEEPVSVVAPPQTPDEINDFIDTLIPPDATPSDPSLPGPKVVFSYPNDYVFEWGINSDGSANTNYPPEGAYSKYIEVMLSGTNSHIDCKALQPLPDATKATSSHIKNISLWKKNPNGTLSYVPNLYASCVYGALYLSPTPSLYDLETFNRYPAKASKDLEFYNRMWLEPNTNYRILLSPEIRDLKGGKIGITNTLGSIDGKKNEYFGLQFNTSGPPCYKSFVDAAGFDSENKTPYNKIGTVKNNPTNSEITPTSNCIFRTGPDNLNPMMLAEIASKFPETNIDPNSPIFTKHSAESVCGMPTGEHLNLTTKKADGVEGACIHNFGSRAEYSDIFYSGYGKSSEDLKKQCSGTWRVNPYSFLWTNFEKTRCPVSGTSPGQLSECKRKKTLDTTQGRWYETSATEITNPKKPEKKIRVKGIHTFWDAQKLYYRVKDNCKEGWYDLIITAKNIYGPLPKDYRKFKLVITNESDGKAYETEIKASDVSYNASATKIYLGKGASNISIVWTNDAYKAGEYDANIQIKTVTLKYLSDGSNDSASSTGGGDNSGGITSIQKISSTGISKDPVTFQVVGNYAYIASPHSGFEIYDVTDSNLPKLVFKNLNYLMANDHGIKKNPDGTVASGDIIVKGNLLFLAGQMEGFSIWDISNPAKPSFSFTSNRAFAIGNPDKIDVEGNYLYTVSFDFTATRVDQVLSVYDISVPTKPIPKGALRLQRTNNQLTSWSPSFTVLGNKVYVALGEDGFGIVDVSNPTAPVLSYKSGPLANNCAVQGVSVSSSNIITYNNCNNGEFDSYGISSPYQHLGSISSKTIGYRLWLYGSGVFTVSGDDYYFIGFGSGTNNVTDISFKNPSTPVLTFSQPIPGDNINMWGPVNPIVQNGKLYLMNSLVPSLEIYQLSAATQGGSQLSAFLKPFNSRLTFAFGWILAILVTVIFVIRRYRLKRAVI